MTLAGFKEMLASPMDKDNLKYTQNKVNDPLAQPHDSNERVAIYKPIAALFF